jgi:DNA-binding transcriptional MerR regulator
MVFNQQKEHLGSKICMATYSIKDLEHLSGIKAHTIRIWEKRYGLINPNRTNTNIRYYNDYNLRQILNISVLSKNGIKISNIIKLSDTELAEKVLLFTQNVNRLDNVIESLIISMLELDENKFDRYLSNIIIKLGFEEAFIKILLPFFDRVGFLWQTGAIFPAQEHFVSNRVRQNLIVAIDNHKDQPQNKKSQFLLFLPEGELHELSLLFCQYLLIKRGFKIFYLGQSLPFSDLHKIYQSCPFGYILTILTMPFPENKMKKFINELSSLFSKTTIFIAGPQLAKINFEIPHNIFRINSPQDFIQHIDELE